ncbi:MAG TPA: hypothetical protein VK811_10580 [Candidatus Acidoferrum sp.]|nr:hypothetical protein [Candidatus Acidoferrum sp.]
MQSFELLREVLEKTSPKKIAGDLDLSESLVYKWGQPPRDTGGNGRADNPLQRIEALIESTGDLRIAQWICQRAGGFFILNPRNTPHPHQAIPATNQIVQEFADLLHVIAAATANEHVSQMEAKQIRARWEELKCVTEGFVAACEQGDFGQLKNHAVKHAAQSQLRGTIC